jgi:hypothetical protein
MAKKTDVKPVAPEVEKPTAQPVPEGEKRDVEPVVEKPKVETKLMLEVKTTSVPSFWRLGRQFTRQPVFIDPAFLSAEQVKSLESVGSKILSVKLVEI